MSNEYLQMGLRLAILVALAIPLGIYISQVMDGDKVFLTKLIRPWEQRLYRVFHIREYEEMGWKQYTRGAIIISLLGLLFVFSISIFQDKLSLSQERLQFWGLLVQDFVSAIVGISVVSVLIRAFQRTGEKKIGNFWVDVVKSTIYIVLPLSIVVWVAITYWGAARDSPLPLIPASLCFAFGRSVGDKRQSVTLFVAMTILLIIPMEFLRTQKIDLKTLLFGGAGWGLYGMLAFVLITAFIAGMLVGRTPEYLGKKIEPFEMKLAVLAALVMPITTFAGEAAPFEEIKGFDIMTAAIMVLGWIVPVVATIAISGSLVEKKRLTDGPGTLPTQSPMFVGVFLIIALLVGILSFLPAVVLSHVADNLQIIG